MTDTTKATSTSPDMQTTAFVVVLIILDSMHFIFAKMVQPVISPGLAVLYVLGISTVEVGIFALMRKELHWKELRQHLGFFLIIGALIAFSTNIDYVVVTLIKPGVASLLNQMTVLFGVTLGVLWMRDKLTWQQGAGIILALTGVFVVSFQPGAGDVLQLGALLAVAAAFMYALHAAISKRHGGDITFLTFFFGRLLFTTVWMIALSAMRGELAWPSAQAWPLLLLVATVDVVLSRTLYYMALRRLTLSMHTLMLTLSPIVAILLAWLFFATLPSLQQLLGGVGIVAGVTIASYFRPVLAEPASILKE